MIPYTIFTNQISVFLNGMPYCIPKDDKRFEKIKEALLAERFDEVSVILKIQDYFKENDKLKYENDILFFQGEKVPACLTDLIVEKASQQEEYEHYLKFFSSLKYNKDFEGSPSKRQLFYKSFHDIYAIGDFVVYDAKQSLPIAKFYALSSFPDSFKNALTTHKQLEPALEVLAGFCSDKLVKEFKNKVFQSEVNPSFINFLDCVKGCFDPSLIYSEYEKVKDKMTQPFSWLNMFFNKFCKNNPKKIIEVLLNTSVEDLSRLAAVSSQDHDYDITLPSWTTVEELIPLYSREVSRRNGSIVFLNLEGRFPEITKLTKVEDYTWVIPQTNLDLADWSSKMNNCISTYSQRAKKGEVLLLGVKLGDKLIYNIEITKDKTIRQFLAARNSKPEAKIEKKLRADLKMNKIIK